MAIYNIPTLDQVLTRSNSSSLGETVGNVAIYARTDYNLYVATTGSDLNNGLTIGSPKLTIQAAVNAAYTLGTGVVTINIATGTYTERVLVRPFMASQGDFSAGNTSGNGGIVLKFQGDDATPSNVVWKASSTVSGQVPLTTGSGCPTVYVSGFNFDTCNQAINVSSSNLVVGTNTATNIAGAFISANNSTVTFATGGSTTITGNSASGNSVVSLGSNVRLVQNHNITATALGTTMLAIPSTCVWAASTVTLSLTKGGAAPVSETDSTGIRVDGFMSMPTTVSITNVGTGLLVRDQGQCSMPLAVTGTFTTCITGIRMTDASRTEAVSGTWTFTTVTDDVKLEVGATMSSADTFDTTVTYVTPQPTDYFGGDQRWGQLASADTWTGLQTFNYTSTDAIATVKAFQDNLAVTITGNNAQQHIARYSSATLNGSNNLTYPIGGLVAGFDEAIHHGSGTIDIMVANISQGTIDNAGVVADFRAHIAALNNSSGSLVDFSAYTAVVLAGVATNYYLFNVGSQFISNDRAITIKANTHQFIPLSSVDTGLTRASSDLVLSTTTSGDIYLTSADDIIANALVTFSTGQAVTAGDYQVGRDADATNQLHFNVPTGASFEWSINDVALVTANITKVAFTNRVLESQGADVASANDLTLGADGNVFEITGAVQINAITTTDWTNGSMIMLLFASTPTVKHNTAGGANTAVILLAGSLDFVATAGDTLTLVLSEIGGVQAWRELCRTTI